MVKKTPAYKNRLRALELERTGGATNKKKSHKQMDKYKPIFHLVLYHDNYEIIWICCCLLLFYYYYQYHFSDVCRTPCTSYSLELLAMPFLLVFCLVNLSLGN